MREYTPSMDDLRLAYQLETQEVDEDGNVVTGFDQAGEMFNRAIAAHDYEVILEYIKRSKPEPIHIDNIDGVKAGDWLKAHDAEVRLEVLQEVRKKLALEWLMFLPEEDTAFAQGARLAIERIREGVEEPG